MGKSVAVLGLVSIVLLGQPLAASEVTVLSAGAVEPGMRAAAAAFEKRTGHVVTISFNTVPQIRTRIGTGTRADVVIATPAVLDELAKAGQVEAERAVVGRVGMGAAIRAGAPLPDISNGEALKRSILAADALVFSRGSSGVYFEGLLKTMGVFEQVERKIVRYDDGASVFAHVMKGKGRDMGFGQLTEIRLEGKKGLQLVGPLPAGAQNYTSYAAVPMAGAPNMDAARELVRYLGAPAARAVFAAAGIDQ